MSARTRSSIPAMIALLAIGSVALVGCRSGSAASEVETPTPTPSETLSATAEPSVTPTTDEAEPLPPTGGFALPASCDDAYSAGMLATLAAENPPLNDAGFTLRATQNVTGWEVLESGIPTLRCTWGSAGERGLATSVSAIADADIPRLTAALSASGFACEEALSGVLCTHSEQTLNRDEEVVKLGESHFFRSGGWVATSWVNYFPDGYTEDIASTVWG